VVPLSHAFVIKVSHSDGINLCRQQFDYFAISKSGGEVRLSPTAQPVAGAPGNALARSRRRDHSLQRDQQRRASGGGAKARLCHERRDGRVGDARARPALIVAEDLGFKIGLAFFALGSLLYGILFVSTGAVPPVLGWWAVVASLLAVVGRWLALVSPDSPRQFPLFWSC
jgi:hypothetical protein